MRAAHHRSNGPTRPARLIVALATAGLLHCDAPPEAPGGAPQPVPRAEGFVDITARTGIDFRHVAGIEGTYTMHEVFGPGVAVFDADNDGDLDVYFTNGGRGRGADAGEGAGVSNRLFRQGPDGTFVDATARSGLGDTGYGMGVAVGDADNDGDLDVYVANVGPDRFYRNNGDGTFADVTREAGIAGDAWSTSVGFCDFDTDGYLDLFVVHYVQADPSRHCSDDAGRPEYCGPVAFRGTPDTLYRNRGDGSFADVSDASGIGGAPGKGLGLICSDLDADGRQDFYVANDGENNFHWHNLGDGRFEDRAVLLGTAVNAFGKPEASMGIALGDVDGDLHFDLFVTHLARESNTLYTRVGATAFSDATAAARLGTSSMPYTGFGTAFFDAESDGDLDLFVANGRVERGGAAPSATGTLDERFVQDYGEPDLLYLNDGAGRFDPAETLGAALRAIPAVSRGAALGDLDADGDLDLIVTHTNGGARVYRNDMPAQGHWLRIRAIDPALGRDAVGATVTVLAEGRRLVRPVTHTYGYLTAVDAETHFGLGPAAAVAWIEVLWPDGFREVFPGSAADRAVRILKGQGTPSNAEGRPRSVVGRPRHVEGG